MNITIDLNVNFPGVLPFLNLFKGQTMTILEDLQASQASVKAHVEALETSNEALILANSQIVDALRALQATAGTGVVTAADVQAVIDGNAALIAAADAEKAKVDAAAAIKP